MNTARIIDYETTGTPDDEAAEVIEMGSIDLDLTSLSLLNPFRAFASPRGAIPAVTKAVHHITEAELEGAPTARELWDTLFQGLPDDAPLVAHNAKFEQHFTPDTGRPWICTYKVARVLWPDAPTHSNQGLRYWLELDLDPRAAEPPHRALPDAYVTAHILRHMLGFKTVAEMIHISKYPALLTRFNFGKHKGSLFSEVPADYLEWIRDKSEMDEDAKFSARYWLKKRGM